MSTKWKQEIKADKTEMENIQTVHTTFKTQTSIFLDKKMMRRAKMMLFPMLEARRKNQSSVSKLIRMKNVPPGA